MHRSIETFIRIHYCLSRKSTIQAEKLNTLFLALAVFISENIKLLQKNAQNNFLAI